MIVSSLESLFLRFLIGAALECNQRGRYAEIGEHMEGLLAWCEQDGITPAAQVEISHGEEIRFL